MNSSTGCPLDKSSPPVASFRPCSIRSKSPWRTPNDDELLTAEEIRALDESSECLKQNRGIPHEQVLAELGLPGKRSTIMGTAACRVPVKRIVWTGPAKADVCRINRETAMRILNTLDRFVSTGESDVKALQGRD